MKAILAGTATFVGGWCLASAGLSIYALTGIVLIVNGFCFAWTR